MTVSQLGLGSNRNEHTSMKKMDIFFANAIVTSGMTDARAAAVEHARVGERRTK